MPKRFKLFKKTYFARFLAAFLGAFLAAAFLAEAFFAGAFLAAFLGATFLDAAFLAGAFLAAAFFGEAFLADAFLGASTATTEAVATGCEADLTSDAFAGGGVVPKMASMMDWKKPRLDMENPQQVTIRSCVYTRS